MNLSPIVAPRQIGRQVAQNVHRHMDVQKTCECASFRGNRVFPLEMNHPAWLLVIVGIVIAVAGAVWLVAPGLPGMGRVPGDIAIERPGFRFYFPVATCLVLSVVLSAIMWLVRWLWR
jgi:hypothetical protein